MANERTFVAWLRTAVSLISLGLAINRLAMYLQEVNQSEGKARHLVIDAAWMGTGFVIFGLVLVVLSASHFRRRTRQIQDGTFEPLSISIVVIGAAILLMGLLGLAWFHRS
ncbi:YidH family protein [Vulgatibacter sp.]|uniref:YidH family protein n=1 Tax=Vulgatibacter sp. TaxID=1971226 RepID=UPI0035649D9B